MDKYFEANVVLSLFAQNYMELKRELPVRPSEMAVINIITKREGDFTPLMLAELLSVSKPMIAAHITALEKKGYIYKEASTCDKRSFYVRPTDKARKLADEIEIKQSEFLKEIESNIGEAAFDSLVKTLQDTNTLLNEFIKK